MATKINPLDFGYVTNVKVTTQMNEALSMEVTITIPLTSVEETEIIRDALLDGVDGHINK